MNLQERAMSFYHIFIEHYEKNNMESIETALAEMRKSGANPLDAAIVLKKAMDLPLLKVDHIILNSKTWADIKEVTLSARDAFFDALNDTPLQ